MCIITAYRKKVVSTSGVGSSVFDEVCLPYQLIYLTNIIRKNQVKEAPKMVKYRKFPQNSSPVEKNVDNFMLTWNSGMNI